MGREGEGFVLDDHVLGQAVPLGADALDRAAEAVALVSTALADGESARLLDLRGRMRKRHRAKECVPFEDMLSVELVVLALRERGPEFFSRILHGHNWTADCLAHAKAKEDEQKIAGLKAQLAALKLANPTI